MTDDFILILDMKVLEVLKNSDSKLTLNEINQRFAAGGESPFSNKGLLNMLDKLFAQKLVQEHVTINILDSTKNKIEYTITNEGRIRYEDLKRSIQDSAARAATRETYSESYYREQEQAKKSNRRWLIFCGIGLVVIIAIVVIVAL
ncbi:MAG: hypothetical protein FK733_14730 [Asgard group archaeon]|nr:hypothetical protein [Asgard group archaeon]